LINSIVSPGTYPDIAFTNGTSAPASDSAVVLGSCDASCIDEENGPFVGTQVTLASVITPKTFTSEVLGTTILVNTGTPLSTYQFVIPGLLIVATLWVNRRAKHGTMKGANQ
jgi:hypothetical protein